VATGLRIGPSDRADIDGDVAHVRTRGADGLRNDTFASGPVSRRTGDGSALTVTAVCLPREGHEARLRAWMGQSG
jgi:hypothetical protein